DRSSRASAENEGAARHSVKIGLIDAASSASTSRLVAITPPYAESGSHSWAALCAAAAVSATAMPQGFARLTMATAGWSKSKAARIAASVSVELVYDVDVPARS